MWMNTAFARRFGLTVPIVQGPFGGGLSAPALSAAVSRAGGLGSYGANILEPDRIAPLVEQIRALAGDRPFALNFWVDASPEPRPSGAVIARTLELLTPFYREMGLPVPATLPERCAPEHEAQVEAALRAGVPVLSFVFGVPSAALMHACRERGVAVIGTATTVDEARALDAAQVDAIVATGFEAGGHRASFLRSAEESLTGTMALVPAVVDAVRAPVIAAGGIADGRGVAAALALGAQGVQVGTAFLACAESGAPPAHREAMFAAGPHDTVLTRVISGRLARALRNRFISAMEPHAGELAGYPALNWLTGAMRREAAKRGTASLMSLQFGQATALLSHRDAQALMDALVEETSSVIEKMSTTR
jgi:nitronate monooxygenase